MNRKDELMIVLMEECAEVIQATSKIFRFGEEAHNPFDKKKIKNIDHLEMEIGDLLGIMKFLLEEQYINGEKVMEAADNKIKRLEKYLKTTKE